MDEPTKKTEKALCAVCGGERNCDVLGSAYQRWDDADGLLWSRTEWFILKCRGCDHMFCQMVEMFSTDYEYEWDEESHEDVRSYNKTIEYLPAISKRKLPDWFTLAAFAGAGSLYGTMRELYVALDNDLVRLAAAGVRTAFDVASELLGADTNLRFNEKLDALVSSNHINGVDRERLEALTEAGSASMHRGWIPTAEHLSTMVDILEHFIHGTFIKPLREKKLTEESINLRKTVPARKPRP